MRRHFNPTILLFLFVFAITSQAQENIRSNNDAIANSARDKMDAVKTGEIAPDFSLKSQNGTTVTLSKIDSPVVLVFYRGYWCPFCGRQLSELRGLLKPGDKVKLFAISVDPAERSNDLIKKIENDGQGKVEYTFLSDPGHQTIDSYGLFDPAYAGKGVEGIPHPAVYVLDKDRKVVWSKVEPDYRKRPTIEEIRSGFANLN